MKFSRIFFPQLIVPKNAAVKSQELQSKSQKLMLDVGLIRHCGNGTYYILPLLQRSIEKLTKIVDKYMMKIDGQKMQMPALTSAELWKKSGRFESAQTELMLTKDRHERLQILSPTHEESVTNLISSISPISYKNLPIRLYQITSKFRDEFRPKFGLLRAKEFIMKDMYTFDIDLEKARETYDAVNEQYAKIMQKLNVPYVKIDADTGNMGGKVSHEYHLITAIGEDSIITCQKCSKSINKELAKDDKICSKCDSKFLEHQQGIEIAHTFILEDRYSKPLKATYLNNKGKPEILQMGCYGIGITRLIASCIEILSHDHEIRWPEVLAPFKVCVIPPKDGSKEEAVVKDLGNKIYSNLVEHLSSDVIIDDRTSMTIGKRLMDMKKLGIPYILVIGAKSVDENPTVEVHSLKNNEVLNLNVNDAINHVLKSIKS